MPVKIEAHAEPIPGYKLIERIGGGGFGEVWKAEAPGGLFKAIKFVFGDLTAVGDEQGSKAEQELKALSRVKTVHHPYILSLERYDIIEGQLIIVMELADRTLWDRFRECRSQGLPGIPRKELLGYLEETAEALDLMNNEFQLQHLDIKPQNLFLVFNHVKVADFGLVKDLGELAAATITGGVTPVYAAPETFDGWLSRFSDQYSLAIVYQELLTGQRPFTGGTMRQLVLQHLQGQPDLTPLPMGDRAAVGRSLAKNPDERFPCCVDLVNALRAAPLITPESAARAPTHVPAAPEAPKVEAPAPEPKESDSVETMGVPNRKGRAPAPEEPAEAKLSPPGVDRPQVLPSRPGTTRLSSDEFLSQPMVPAGGFTQTSSFAARARASKELEAAEHSGILRPALILGLGKLGLETLRQFRKQLSQQFGVGDALPHVRLLGIDTDADAVQAVSQGDPESQLRSSEVILARLQRPSHYLKPREGKFPVESWINSKHLFRIPRTSTSAGMRALGRLAFIDHYRTIVRRFESELEACCNQDTLEEISEKVDLGFRTRVPRVYVVTSLGGTTGSGMFLDAAYVMQTVLRRLGHASAEVVGIFLLPNVSNEGIRSPELANCFAALSEFKLFGSGHEPFTARYDTSEGKPVQEAGPPFHRSYVLPLPAKVGSGEELPAAVSLAGEFLFRDLATALGRANDQIRSNRKEDLDLVGQVVFETFGFHQLRWPRRRLLHEASSSLCRQLVDRWMTKNAKPIAQEVHEWSQQQWEAYGLRPENLIGRHQEECEKLVKQPPEKMFQGVVGPLAKVLAAKPAGDKSVPNLSPVVQVMDQIEKWLGIPDECRPPVSVPPEPGQLEKALASAAEHVAADCEQKVTEMVVRLIETPLYRLAGAEEAMRYLCGVVDQALQIQEGLAKELHERSSLMYLRIHALLENPVSSTTPQTASMWKGAFARRAPNVNVQQMVNELLELLKTYPKIRYQSIILANITRLYVGLRGQLSDQIREVGFCRHRLGELNDILRDKAPPPAKRSSAHEKLLLPEGCETFADAVERVEKSITVEDLRAFDDIIQAFVQKEYRALVQVCMGPSQVVRTLAPAMLREAAQFILPRIEGESVAGMFLAGKDHSESRAEIAEALAEAKPAIPPTPGAKELLLVTLPDDSPGRQLRDLIEEVAARALVVSTENNDEIVVYKQFSQIKLSELEQMGPSPKKPIAKKK